MNLLLSKDLEKKLAQKLQEVNNTSTTEQTFVKLECLFYDVLTLGRLLEPNAISHHFLSSMEKIKANTFYLTQQPFNKAKQREIAIKKFKTAFKKELSFYLKTVST